MRASDILRTLLVCGTVFVSGCSTEYFTGSVAEDAPAGTSVNGVPFRLSQPHLLKVYQKTPYGYVPVHQTVENLPNQKQVYVLRLDSGLLSDADLDVQLKQDGTLLVVETSAGKSKGGEALSELGNAINAIEKAVASRKKANETTETAKKQAFEGELDDQALALQLKLEADLSQAAFDALGDESAEDVRQERRKQLLLAKFAANIAYQKLGYPAPFPEVTFP